MSPPAADTPIFFPSRSFGRLDRPFFRNDDSQGCIVALRAEQAQVETLHDREQVGAGLGATHVELTGGDSLNGCHRAVAAGNVQVDAALLEISELARGINERVLTCRQPRQGVADFRELCDCRPRKRKSNE